MLFSPSIKQVLLLQGPMGPFFHRLAAELTQQGKQVTKINFNAGDWYYYREGLAYRDGLDAWPSYLERLIQERSIDAVVLFGDGRPYHRAAVAVAHKLGRQVLVFEEGYMRPDWITFERDGVNANSHVPRDPHFYRRLADGTREPGKSVPVGKSFRYGGWYSTVYSIALTLGALLYPRYTHHRPLNAVAEAFYWVRSGVRKLVYRFRERFVLERLVALHSGKYFLVALQVHCDYQLAHSGFATVEQFIEHVVASFAAHAPADHVLVIKHHPMDRPYREYGALMKSLAARHGLGERLVYIHDLHLPTLLRHASGSVMINSTVGLQSIQYGKPVKLLGKAVYDMPGLTYQGTLEDFWKRPGTVDDDLYRRFRAYLMRTNQLNGSFYKRLEGVATQTGVRWLSVLLATLLFAFGASRALAEVAPSELRADTSCGRDSEDCNPCVSDVPAQVASMFSDRVLSVAHDYSFRWSEALPPADVRPDDALVGGFTGYHVQGFARTNSDRVPFVASHSFHPHGSLYVVARDGAQLRVQAIQPLVVPHPSGVSVIGRYAMVADGEVVHLFDVERAHAVQSIRLVPHGLRTRRAGGGLGMAKLVNGHHLMIVSTPGSRNPGPRHVLFFELRKPLASRSQGMRALGSFPYAQPAGWEPDYAFSENLSVITECGSGSIYTLHASGDDRLRGHGYFRLSRVQAGSAGPELVPLARYRMPQRQRNCHPRSAASWFARADHKLELYCSERAAVRGLGLIDRESLRFKRRFVR